MKKLYNKIFACDDYVVVNKSPGLLSIPDRYDPEKVNLRSLLEKTYDNVFPVHRIDKDTSGVICFALNEEAHQKLSLSF